MEALWEDRRPSGGPLEPLGRPSGDPPGLRRPSGRTAESLWEDRGPCGRAAESPWGDRGDPLGGPRRPSGRAGDPVGGPAGLLDWSRTSSWEGFKSLEALLGRLAGYVPTVFTTGVDNRVRPSRHRHRPAGAGRRAGRASARDEVARATPDDPPTKPAPTPVPKIYWL